MSVSKSRSPPPIGRPLSLKGLTPSHMSAWPARTFCSRCVNFLVRGGGPILLVRGWEMIGCAVSDVDGDDDVDVDVDVCVQGCGKVVVGYRIFNRSNDICHV